MTNLEVHINYQARQPSGTANLRAVTLTTALRVGATASALVRLSAPAPAPGFVVKLTSSDPSALAVPGQVLVPAGEVAVTAPVQVLKATSGVPPTLTAATADGVTRRALAPVSKKEPLVARSAVLGTLDGATYAVAVGRFPTGGPRPGPC